MRIQRLIGSALAGTLALSIAACNDRPPANSGGRTGPGGETQAPVAAADIGDPLFPPAAVPPRAPSNAPAIDPIVVQQCQITLPRTENVPTKNEGRLFWFCTKIQPGEVVPPDKIVVHPRTKEKYRRLHEGDRIESNQLVALLDDELAFAKFKVAEATEVANAEKKRASQEILKAAIAVLAQSEEGARTGSVSKYELLRDRAQKDRAEADVAEATGQIRKSEEERKMASVVLAEHEIRSMTAGVVKRFYRREGEAVKALDPVAEVQNLDLARVEGQLDAQYMPLLAPAYASRQAIKVTVESSTQVGFIKPLIGHFQPVRAVAVSKDQRRPLIVSASEDKTVRAWRPNGDQVANWRHPVPVRTVACTPPGSEGNYALSGADDGLLRLWDLDNPATDKPVREFKGRHQGQIVCVAFAPDGKTCVSADANDIYLWDVAGGELRYRFPKQHKGPITCVQYTPQAKLVSAARDKSLCVWKLGEKGAAVENVIDFRGGDVPVLGVSPDGQRVLFDQERALNVLSINDASFQRNEGFFPAPSEASRFSDFAIFSPDGRVVLAAGTGDNPLQLWKVPQNGGRGHLIRRAAPGSGVQATCGAFAPDGSFAVTGTSDYRVLVWGIPNKPDLDRMLTGTVTFVDTSINPADRKARVWAELPNPKDNPLNEGDTVTLVIEVPEPKR